MAKYKSVADILARHNVRGYGSQNTDPNIPYSGGGVPYGDIAEKINVFQTGQSKLPFIANLPDYEGMVQQRSNILKQQMAGEVPQDVVNQLIQRGAERSIGGGMGTGSPSANAAYLQALGLTSIGQQQAGMGGLSTAIADTPVPPLFDVGGLFASETLGQQELDALLRALQEQQRFGGGGGKSVPWSSSAWSSGPGHTGLPGVPTNVTYRRF